MRRSRMTTIATIAAAVSFGSSSRQQPRQHERIEQVALEPEVELPRPPEDDRHRLRMDARHGSVGLRRQKVEQLMLALYGCTFRPTHAAPAHPNTREGELDNPRSTRTMSAN
jgi:hypothetical protein